MSDLFRAEIGRQPVALDAAVSALAAQEPVLADLARLTGTGPRVVLTGMGSSYDACLGAASILGRAGVAAMSVTAAELLHFRQPILGPDSMLVTVSQSGHTVELVRLLDQLAAGPARPMLVAITNGRDNPVARAADIALDMGIGEERGPATMSFLGTLAALAVLVRIVAGDDPAAALAALRTAAVPAGARIRTLLAGADDLAASLERWLDGRSHLVLVGRGAARAAAEVGALVLKEAAGYPAQSLDAAQFRHGPIELAGPSLALAVVATEPATYALDAGLAGELAAHGTAVLLLGSEPGAVDGVRAIPLGRLDPLLAAGVATVPLQLLAWRLAVAGGREPGVFRTGGKVTTRE